MADQITLRSPLAEWADAFTGLPDEVRIAELPFLTQLDVRVDPAGPAAVAAGKALSGQLPTMTSDGVAALLAELQITRSHSRSKVSNDNPYSEAAFKTLKYCPVFPERFGSLADAHVFCETFFTYYNHEHRHSGIGLHTPASVHFGTAAEIREQRAATLEAAYAANPGRFRKKPTPPTIPAKAWINDPDKREKQVQNN
ncbi:integrase core domain-containing protein [Streptosporangium sp. NPDC087985]|uniref:integrase core domain-containing protein n=1 Tax=Streptosporangium sp. NPDC087985 TaxID=3366196 RepID=UPI0037FF7372